MKLKLMIRAAILMALIIVGAKIQIPLPYFDYYTLQFTFVLLTGVMLKARYAALTVGGYLLLGLAGLPVFAGGGGISYVLKPSFGYLLGFFLSAVAISILYDKKMVKTFSGYLTYNLIGIVITYLVGLTYKVLIMAIYLNQAIPYKIILISSLSFDIPADLIMVIGLSALEAKVMPEINQLFIKRAVKFD